MTVRTRFAPSPTGYLHVGGARTALFSYLYARRHGGVFVLRIEDTDRERSTAESVNAILEGMAWLGLEYDEGPFYQTERFDRYNAIIDELLGAGHAYRCDCSRERLDELRESQRAAGLKPRYDGRCRARNVSATSEHVVRFRNPDAGTVVVDDLIRGPVAFDNAELDDLVIRRSDGTPTYNLSVVADDLDMRITHVIRGDDHLNNTPRQINLLRAIGAELPRYAHVPMILGDDGQRLSKRHGAVSVIQFRDDGFLPEALLNHLVRLGWSHGDQELFTLDEMIGHFDLGAVNKAAASFNTDKLSWFNQHYLKSADTGHIATLLRRHLGALGIDPDDGPPVAEVVTAQRERATTLVEMATQSAMYFRDFDDFDADAAKAHLRPVALPALEAVRAELAKLDAWDGAEAWARVQQVAETMQLKVGKVAQPLRVAVTGRAASPSIDVTLALIGRDATLRRLDRAIEFTRAREAVA
ncbi:MAG: glutamate--tRNA ligase [Chromatiales bacterium]|nr:glutamate--tRNA ligase [Chromatiales bacterium]